MSSTIEIVEVIDEDRELIAPNGNHHPAVKITLAWE